MPTKNAKMVKLPEDVYDRLVTLAESYMEAHVAGSTSVPFREVHGHAYMPLHCVITKALDHLEDHRKRSNRKRSK